VVECFLAKEDVAGSTPVSRSNNSFCGTLHTTIQCVMRLSLRVPGFVRFVVTKRRGTQVVRERSAKPLCVGSIPTRASTISESCGSRKGAFLFVVRLVDRRMPTNEKSRPI
jgi:hypothetical protein